MPMVIFRACITCITFDIFLEYLLHSHLLRSLIGSKYEVEKVQLYRRWNQNTTGKLILNILLNALHAVDSVYDSRCMRFETELLIVFPQMPRLNLYVFTHGEIFYYQRAVKKFLSIFKYEIALFVSQIRVETLADSSVSRQEVTYAVLISFYFISLLSFLNSSIVKPFFL